MGEIFANLALNGQLLIAIPVAMLAGLVSFASPCVLPLLPGYLGFVGGMTDPNARRPTGRLFAGIGLFVLGFSVVFVSYGAAFGAAGAWLIRWQDLITRIMGVLVILMGIAFVGLIGVLQRRAAPSFTPRAGLAGAPLLGVVFAIGWTPCLGPTLTAISLLSLNSASPWRGALLAFAYALGLGIPFLLVALGFGWMTGAVAWLKRHIRLINILGGAMLIVIGVLMVSGLWTAWIYSLQALIGGVTLPI